MMKEQTVEREVRRRPRVLIVTTWFPTKTAPMTGIFVQRDAHALKEVAELRVLHLVNPAQGGIRDTECIDGVYIERFPMSPSSPVSVYQAAQQIRRRMRGADIVHSVAMSSLLPMSLVRPKIPWIHTEHWSGYVDWDQGLRRFARKCLALMSRGPHIVAAVSPLLADRLAHLSGRPVEVVPNIVEMPDPQVRPKYDGHRPLQLVSVGNLIPRKRPVLAAQTCAELNSRGIATHLHWVGTGELDVALREQAQELGVALTMHGLLSKEEIAEVLAQADAALIPTEAETFCLVAAEALAAGRPTIVGANGGQRLFVHPPAGALVEGDSARDYADAVERVLEQSQEITAEEIAAFIRNEYSSEALGYRYKGLYDRLIQERFVHGAEGLMEGQTS